MCGIYINMCSVSLYEQLEAVCSKLQYPPNCFGNYNNIEFTKSKSEIWSSPKAITFLISQNSEIPVLVACIFYSLNYVKYLLYFKEKNVFDLELIRMIVIENLIKLTVVISCSFF